MDYLRPTLRSYLRDIATVERSPFAGAIEIVVLLMEHGEVRWFARAGVDVCQCACRRGVRARNTIRADLSPWGGTF